MSEEEVFLPTPLHQENFGIVCVLSSHSRLSGKLKEKYQDFKVTELDINGKPVSLQPAKHSQECTQGSQEQDRKQDRKKNLTVKEEVWKRQPEQKWEEKNTVNFDGILSESVSEELLQELKTFSEKHRCCYGISHHQGNQDQDDGDSLSLGIFENKEVRTKLHHCVKQLHPHLRTSTNKVKGQTGSEIIVSPDPLYQEYRDLLDPHQTNQLFQFIDSKEGNTILHLSVGDCKDKRTKIHRLVAKHFGSMVETKTFVGNFKSKTPDTQTSIVVRFRDKFQKRGVKRQFPGETDRDLAEYTAFTLKKEDIETLDAIQKIAMATNSHPSQFSYAGIKDKKAVTMQAMVVRNVTPSRLQASMDNRALHNITIGSIQRCSGPLRLGQLGGNHFDVVVRDVKLHTAQDASINDIISEAVKSLKTNGFINYYGKQRFGAVGSAATADRIGLALLQGNMKKAIDLFFLPDDGNHYDELGNHGDNPVNHAKRNWQTSHNAKETLAVMPSYKSRECMILKALHRHGQSDEGCSKAVMAIPHSMRILYIHSYCSLVWNHMATHRIQTYGYQVMKGDLVEVKENDQTKVHIITSEDIQTGRYSITDVVLPLPGNKITMPENTIKEKYHQYLQSDNLSFEQFRVPALKMNISGDYRKLIAFPCDLEWNIVEDKSDTVDTFQEAISTEVSAVSSPLADLESTSCAESSGNSQDNISTSISKVDSHGGKSVAMATMMSFCLQPSSYATVCLREIFSSLD